MKCDLWMRLRVLGLRWRFIAGALGLLAVPVTALAAGAVEAPVPHGPSAEHVQLAESGQLDVVNAAWWGVDAEDATAAIQAAIDTGAATVVVPDTGAPWIVRPIRLRSDLELVFADGVVVEAKAGAFRGKNESLLTAIEASNLTIRGNATLQMRKADYMAEPYEKAEWRMAIGLFSCRNVVIEGLTLKESGGDGVYLGVAPNGPRYNENVQIRDVVCDGNLRQGISVISAHNLLIERCRFINTSGTAPGAGIDLEPNSADQRLSEIVIRDCVADANEGSGLLIYLRKMDAQVEPISVLVENFHVTSGNGYGISIGAIQDDGPTGEIVFKDCVVEKTQLAGLHVYDKSAKQAKIKFVRCTWRDVAQAQKDAEAVEPEQMEGRNPPLVPLTVFLRRPSFTQWSGGVWFEDCLVEDSIERPIFVGASRESGRGTYAIHGSIRVRSPFEPAVHFEGDTEDINLTVTAAP